MKRYRSRYSLESRKKKTSVILIKSIWAGFLTILAGCQTSPILKRSEVIDQILRPRPGFAPHLTNQIIKDGKPEVVTYDLSSQETRTLLNELKFICKLSGRRFYVCLDKPGICRNTFETKDRGWFRSKKTIKRVEFKDIATEYELFLAAKLVCFSQESYQWDAF